jgi:hypothetical protein
MEPRNWGRPVKGEILGACLVGTGTMKGGPFSLSWHREGPEQGHTHTHSWLPQAEPAQRSEQIGSQEEPLPCDTKLGRGGRGVQRPEETNDHRG